MSSLKTYRELLLSSCTKIVNQIVDSMQVYNVGSKDKIPVPHAPILYRWWFHKDSVVVSTLTNLNDGHSEFADLLKGVETREFEGEIYYALYFGKSNNGYRRFCQHSTGNVHTSTLRRTIHSLLTDEEYNKPIHEKQIDEILKDCYFEWAVIDKEEESLVECIEAICIVHGTYPLNIDGNPAINEIWREHMMKERGKVKDNI